MREFSPCLRVRQSLIETRGGDEIHAIGDPHRTLETAEQGFHRPFFPFQQTPQGQGDSRRPVPSGQPVGRLIEKIEDDGMINGDGVWHGRVRELECDGRGWRECLAHGMREAPGSRWGHGYFQRKAHLNWAVFFPPLDARAILLS